MRDTKLVSTVFFSFFFPTIVFVYKSHTKISTYTWKPTYIYLNQCLADNGATQCHFSLMVLWPAQPILTGYTGGPLSLATSWSSLSSFPSPWRKLLSAQRSFTQTQIHSRLVKRCQCDLLIHLLTVLGWICAHLLVHSNKQTGRAKYVFPCEDFNIESSNQKKSALVFPRIP